VDRFRGSFSAAPSPFQETRSLSRASDLGQDSGHPSRLTAQLRRARKPWQVQAEMFAGDSAGPLSPGLHQGVELARPPAASR